MKSLFFILIFISTTVAFAEGKKVAVVKMLRGEVEVLTLGKTTKLKVEDWVEDGATVKTLEKSMVKLIFLDKSQMNIGPNSEMKIEKFSGTDAGVIDLVKGQIRSQVSKDYLQIKDKDKSKLFIKTPNAVMGVRGTDFLITTNGPSTVTLLFEGSIVLNKLSPGSSNNTNRLEDMVNRGVRLHPGDFSKVNDQMPQPTIPARMNQQQLEKLEKNDTFDSRSPSSASNTEAKTVVPEGLSGAAVSNDATALKTEVAQVVGAASPAPEATAAAFADANGYIKGDQVKPANGSFVHIESGVIIPPGDDSILDANTNTYIPGPNSGKVAADGSYIPPANVEITSEGKILVVTTTSSGQKQVVEKPAPSVVKAEAPRSVASTSGPAGAASPSVVQKPRASDPFNPGGLAPVARPAPSGGVPDVNQAVQQNNFGPVMRTFRPRQD